MLLKNYVQGAFILRTFVYNVSFESLFKREYALAKNGVSITEQNLMPLFEVDSLFDLLIEERKRENEELKANPYASNSIK